MFVWYTTWCFELHTHTGMANYLTYSLSIFFFFFVLRTFVIHSFSNFQVYSTLILTAVTNSYNRSLELIPAISLKLCALWPKAPPPPPLGIPFYFLLLWIPLSRFCIRDHAVFLSVPVLLHQAWCPWKSFVLLQITECPSFYGWIISCICMYHIFFICSSSTGHSGWFYVSATVTGAAMNTGKQICLQHADFISFGYTPRSGIAESE